MDYRDTSSNERQIRVATRGRTARLLAWPVRIGLLVCVATAIWQEPALAPRLHDGMKFTAESIQDRLGANDRVAAFFK